MLHMHTTLVIKCCVNIYKAFHHAERERGEEELDVWS